MSYQRQFQHWLTWQQLLGAVNIWHASFHRLTKTCTSPLSLSLLFLAPAQEDDARVLNPSSKGSGCLPAAETAVR